MPKRESVVERMVKAYSDAEAGSSKTWRMLVAVKKLRSMARGDGRHSSSVFDWLNWVVSNHEHPEHHQREVLMPKLEPTVIERMETAFIRERDRPYDGTTTIDPMLAAVKELKAIVDELYDGSRLSALGEGKFALGMSGDAINAIIYEHERRERDG